MGRGAQQTRSRSRTCEEDYKLFLHGQRSDQKSQEPQRVFSTSHRKIHSESLDGGGPVQALPLAQRTQEKCREWPPGQGPEFFQVVCCRESEEVDSSDGKRKLTQYLFYQGPRV